MGKVTAMTADTAVSKDDLLMTIDAPGSTPASRKVTVEDLFEAISVLTSAAESAAGDELLAYDASASGPRRMTKDVLLFLDSEGNPAALATAADGTSEYAARRDHVHSNTIASPILTGNLVHGTNVIEAVGYKTAIADNSATQILTVTTANETGDTDGGVYMLTLEIATVHVGGAAGDNAIVGGNYRFVRAMKSTGVGQNSAVVEFGETAAAESEGGTTKGIAATVTITVVETSEYVMSVLMQVDLDGNAVTNATVIGRAVLVYTGFTTAPVIAWANA